MTFTLPSLADQRAALLARIDAAGLGDHRSQLEALFANGVAFRTQPPATDEAPLGSSHLGGLPDLPDGLEWPTASGARLTPILQLNLADVAGLDPEQRLPQAGWLWLFADSLLDSPTILLAPEHAVLERRTASRGATVLPSAGLIFQPTVQPAPPKSRFVEVDVAGRPDSLVQLPEAGYRSYWDDVVVAWNEQLAPPPKPGESGCHQLFGHRWLRRDLRRDDEAILFVIDSDAIIGLEIADRQTATILIGRDALADRDFSKLRVVP